MSDAELKILEQRVKALPYRPWYESDLWGMCGRECGDDEAAFILESPEIVERLLVELRRLKGES